LFNAIDAPQSAQRIIPENTLILSSSDDSRWSSKARIQLNAILESAHQCLIDSLNGTKDIIDFRVPTAWIPILQQKIHNTYNAAVSLTSLSEYIHINKTTVAKCFRDITGCSVTEYILRYRLQIATYALATTSLKVKEIAEECGFSSDSYFAKRFKAHIGMTPSEYRANTVNRRKEMLNSHPLSVDNLMLI